MTDNNPRAVTGDNSRDADVQRTAEEIAEIAKFLRNNAGPGAPYRSRALAVGAVAPITDAAFRLYALRLIFANSEGEDIFPSQKTLGLLLGKNERHVRRLDDELKQDLYPDIRLMNTVRRRRASATFNLISGIPMDRLVAELSGGLDRTEMSGQDAQDRTDLAGQDVKTGHFGFKTGQECPPTLEEDPIKEAAATGRQKARGKEGGARPSQEVREAFEAYNATAQKSGFPIARKLDANRQKFILARLNDYGGLIVWHRALENLATSNFLRNSSTFRADLGWLIDPKKGVQFERLLDGRYTDRECEPAPVGRPGR